MKTIHLRPMEETLAETTALCPACLKTLAARRVRRGAQVFLERTCPEHGPVSTLIWNGAPSYESWGGAAARQGVAPEEAHDCPRSCGLCADHRRATCCLLFEVTRRCNLGCPVCYASSGGADEDPPLEELGRWYDAVYAQSGPCNIQLSGGEPTVRDDLPEIVAMGKERGFPYLQLNTNGLRLAAEAGYARRLKEAGLDCVFLQFDGVEDGAYTALRGRGLLAEKRAAVDACAAAGLGVVLVPTLVPGVNDNQLGDVIRYAVSRMPDVRGVHFQPISYFGRYPHREAPARLTIPDVLRALEEQTGGAMRAAHFKPGTAENPCCSFNGAYLLEPDGSLSPLRPRQSCCCGGGEGDRTEVGRAQRYVARQWGRDGRTNRPGLRLVKPESLEDFLERAGQYTLAVSGMVFMDPWTADLARLRECYIHVMKDGRRILPFGACTLFHRRGET